MPNRKLIAKRLNSASGTPQRADRAPLRHMLESLGYRNADNLASAARIHLQASPARPGPIGNDEILELIDRNPLLVLAVSFMSSLKGRGSGARNEGNARLIQVPACAVCCAKMFRFDRAIAVRFFEDVASLASYPPQDPRSVVRRALEGRRGQRGALANRETVRAILSAWKTHISARTPSTARLGRRGGRARASA